VAEIINFLNSIHLEVKIIWEVATGKFPATLAQSHVHKKADTVIKP